MLDRPRRAHTVGGPRLRLPPLPLEKPGPPLVSLSPPHACGVCALIQTENRCYFLRHRPRSKISRPPPPPPSPRLPRSCAPNPPPVPKTTCLAAPRLTPPPLKSPPAAPSVSLPAPPATPLPMFVRVRSWLKRRRGKAHAQSVQ